MVAVSSGAILAQGSSETQISSRAQIKGSDGSSTGSTSKSGASSNDFSAILQQSSQTTSSEDAIAQQSLLDLRKADAKKVDAKTSSVDETKKDEAKRQESAGSTLGVTMQPSPLSVPVALPATPSRLSDGSLTKSSFAADGKLTDSARGVSKSGKQGDSAKMDPLKEAASSAQSTISQTEGFASSALMSTSAVKQSLHVDSPNHSGNQVASAGGAVSADQSSSAARLQALVHSVLQQSSIIGNKGSDSKVDPSSSSSGDAAISPNILSGPGGNAVQSTAMRANDSAIQTPVQTPGFSQALGQHLVMMVGQNVSSARIHVSPQELGPIAVEIRMQGQGQVHVSMLVNNNTTHQVLQQALPQLHDLFQAQGMNMQASLSGGQGQGQGGQQAPTREEWLMNTQAGPGSVSIAAPLALAQSARSVDRQGALDLYA